MYFRYLWEPVYITKRRGNLLTIFKVPRYSNPRLLYFTQISNPLLLRTSPFIWDHRVLRRQHKKYRFLSKQESSNMAVEKSLKVTMTFKENIAFRLKHRIKHSSNQVSPTKYTAEKTSFSAATFTSLWVVPFLTK